MINQSLVHSFKVQSRVIWALVMREIITRYGRSNIGFLWLIVEPMIFSLAITFFWTSMKDVQSFKLPITAFVMTGYSSVLLWRNMATRCSGAMAANIGLLYHRNVRVIDVFYSRIILEFVGATIAFFILCLGFTFFELMDPPNDVLKVSFGWLMLGWFGLSLAITLGTLSEKYEIVDKLWIPVRMFLYPMSGLGFMVDWLPPAAQNLMLKFPMVHGLELLREGYFGDVVKSHYDMEYMVCWCLFMTFFGLSFARKLSREISPG